VFTFFTIMEKEYIKAMFGQHAVHAAFNYIVQESGTKDEDRGLIAGNTSFVEAMSFGGVNHGIHTLVLCDVVIRPRLVIASSHLKGSGASGLFKGMALATVKPWLDQGKIIINNMPG
jgi:hypothetical protein